MKGPRCQAREALGQDTPNSIPYHQEAETGSQRVFTLSSSPERSPGPGAGRYCFLNNREQQARGPHTLSQHPSGPSLDTFFLPSKGPSRV